MFSKLSWSKEVRSADLTDAECRVLWMLSTYTDKTGSNAYPGNVRLADDCRMQARSVRRILRRLEAKGWIRRTQDGGSQTGSKHASVYKLTSPVVHTEDRGVPRAGDQSSTDRGPEGPPYGGPSKPLTGDRGVLPSDQPSEDKKSDHASSPQTGDTHRYSRAVDKKQRNPKTAGARDDFDKLAQQLEDEGLNAVNGTMAAALTMWDNGDDPRIIVAALRTQVGAA